MLNYGLFVILRRDYKVIEGDDKLDESKRAELEAEMERLFGIEKQKNEEAESYRNSIRYGVASNDSEKKMYRNQVEIYQSKADEAGNKAREIQKQLESVDTPPEQPTIDTVQHTVFGAETETTESQTTPTQQYSSKGWVRSDTLDTNVEVQTDPVGENAITPKPSESDTNETAADSIEHSEQSDVMDTGQTGQKQPDEELNVSAGNATETEDPTETMKDPPETAREILIGTIPVDVMYEAVEKMTSVGNV